jgi:hypothetical protein
MPNLPTVGGDNNVWGTKLNTWLSTDHDTTAYHKPRVIDREHSLDVTVLPGDVVYWDSTAQNYKQALASGAGNQPQLAVGVVSQSDPAVVTIEGFTDTTAVLNQGSDYYLSSITAGRITPNRPLTNIVRIGHAVSSSVLLVRMAFEEDSLDTTVAYPVRTFNTTYQPDANYPVVVTLSTQHIATAVGGVSYLQVLADTTSPPVTVRATSGTTGFLNPDSTNYYTTTFLIGRANYYRVNSTTVGGTVTSVNWNESSLKE